MILFFGTRQVVRDDDRPGGMQQCQNCGQYAMFTPRVARTYFHVFWIPIFPIGAGQPIVECQNCHARFAV